MPPQEALTEYSLVFIIDRTDTMNDQLQDIFMFFFVI